MLWMRCHLPVTPGTCRMLLVDDERTAFDVCRSFANIPDRRCCRGTRKMTPALRQGRCGRVSRPVYAETVTSIAGVLAADVEWPFTALSTFLAKLATGLRSRKLEFCARGRR